MRALGHTLLWVGFLGAAFVSVSRLENADDKWATIPWGYYFTGVAIGVAGIVCLRKAQQIDHADEERTEAEFSVVQESLAHLTTTVGDLCDHTPGPSEVVRRIDEQCAESFLEFADARQAMVKRFGLTVYADVMTEFASAERYVNRSWSAAADGYVDEVSSSLQRARVHLHAAGDLLAAAENRGVGERCELARWGSIEQ